VAEHPMLTLIDKYLADLPASRDLVPAQAVRDLLLDIRLTFMVAGDEEPPAAPSPYRYRWGTGTVPPGIDGGLL
jgi:hypothetical protein